MPYVNLPPGNSSLRFADGLPPARDKPGGRVWLSDERARATDAMPGNGTAGLITASFREYGSGGKPGRRCTGCGRVYYAWTMTCPRPSCGAPTEPESSAVAAAAASRRTR